jgi:N-acetylneuraminate synthase
LPFVLLHCTNIYPTPSKLIRLDAINVLKKTFPDALVGLSDHSETIYPCLGAIALGACIIEKHFTDNKKNEGPDMSSSMDEAELKTLITGSRIIFDSRGNKKKAVGDEKSTSKFAFASLVATEEIRKGEKLTQKNCFPKRPGTGDFLAKDYKYILGKTTYRKIIKNTLIKKKDIS